MDAYSEAARIVAAYQGGPLDTIDAARIVECCGRLLAQRERARAVLDEMPADWARVRSGMNEVAAIVGHPTVEPVNAKIPPRRAG
jgi:hypothetical protein